MPQLPGAPLTEDDLQKLAACWITRELAEQARLRRVSHMEGAELVGRKPSTGNYGGIIFPYIWPGEDRVREERLRRDLPDLDYTSNPPKELNKYLSPAGRGNLLYFGPGTPPQFLEDASLPVIITEGEKKTLALHQLSRYQIEGDKPRFLPIGIPGVWNWKGTIGKESGPDGERRDIKGPIADLEYIEWEKRKVTILFDVNVHFNSKVRAARSEFGKELRGRGAQIYFAVLPKGLKGVNGVDDYLAREGPNKTLELIEQAHSVDIKLPPGFSLDEDGEHPGLRIENRDTGENKWICAPLRVVAATRSYHGDEWALLVQFRDLDGLEHTWRLPMDMLIGESNEYQKALASKGLMITTNKKDREMITNYLQMARPEMRLRSVSRVGWNKNVYVLPDATFGEEADTREKVYFETDKTHLLNVEGSVQDWRDNVAALCEGNTLLMFSVSCAFAAPLLPLLSELGGGFHLRGPSSTGKTTALLAAGSVWGGGGASRGYLQSWKTTTNGLEAIAEMHNHGLLCLDDINECDPKLVGQIAYMLANGTGKIRATREVKARKRTDWLLMFLSNGEVSLQEYMAGAGQRVLAGQEVRMCDLPAVQDKDQGIFEHLHGRATPRRLAEEISVNSRRFYGAPIREYLSMLGRKRLTIADQALQHKAYFMKMFPPKEAGGEVMRVASRFAIVAAAGELASEITGWKMSAAMEACAMQFERWLDTRGTSGALDLETGCRVVHQFIEAHGASRFQDLENADQLVRDRVGFKHRNKMSRETEYYILPESFKKEVCPGFDHTAILAALADKRHLRFSEGHPRFTMKVQLPDYGPGRVRVHCYLPTPFEEGDDGPTEF